MLHLLLLYSAALLVSVLMSERFARSILSTSVLFLGVGAFAAAFQLVGTESSDTLVAVLAEAALFAVLFTDGMELGLDDLKEAIHLPGRALLLGMPLTLVGTAVLAARLTGLPWREAFLLGAILSPTDPVLVSAIIGRQDIPRRLRDLLQVESGLNDGLALPFVILILASLHGAHSGPLSVFIEVAAGIAIGVAAPWFAIRLDRIGFFAASEQYAPLLPAAAGLLVFSICKISHANEYLASFAAGVTIATCSRESRERSHAFGGILTEMLKLAALMVFGALLSVQFFATLSASDFLFCALALVAVRPLALYIAMLGAALPWPEWATAAWFGPKGFASVTYSLLVLRSGIDEADKIFHLAALVVVASIVAHSSTDVPVARWFARRAEDAAEES
jgi:NhaP-type Na+/H+ or K+/H+ antiporter